MNQKMFMVYGMPKKEGNTKRWDLGYSKAQNPKQKKAKKKKKNAKPPQRPRPGALVKAQTTESV